MKRFTERIVYASDSRGSWRNGDPTGSDAFRAGRSFQILVHPIWWTETPISPFHRLDRHILEATKDLQRSVAANNHMYRIGQLAPREDR